MSLVCKVHCDSLAHIRNEGRFIGIKKGMVNADSVASIHLPAVVEKHLKYMFINIRPISEVL